MMNLFAENRRAGDVLELKLDKSVSVSFVWCPAGNFQLGDLSNGEPHIGEFERPVIDIKLTQGFWISETPLTRQQVSTLGFSQKGYLETSNHSPASELTWKEAMIICDALTEVIPQRNTTKMLDMPFQISLPTEAQWEYACRATSNQQWFFGDNERDLHRYAWYAKSDGFLPQVRSKKPNKWGLYDLYGMVYEWCLDYLMAYKSWEDTVDPCIDDNHPIIKAHIVDNPFGSPHIVRGGCILNTARQCRSSSRRSINENNPDDELTGIRPVLKQIPNLT